MKNTTEKTLAVFRPAKRTAVPGAAIGVLAIIGAFIAAKCSDEGGIPAAVVLGMVGFICLLWSLCRLIDIFLNYRYEITTTRIIAKRGFLVTHKTAVRLEDVRGVDEAQGIWGSMLGYSTLTIGTAATGSAEVTLESIANADQVKSIIEGSRK